MANKLIFLGILLFLTSSLSGCHKAGESELGEKELLRINDVSLSLGEFQEMLERQPLEGKMKLLSQKGTRDFLENYVIPREVLHQEAKKTGLDKNKEILAKIEDARRAILIDALLKEAVTKLSQGESFETLASAYNIGNFKEDGGNLGYIRRGQLAPPFAQFEEVAFSLRKRGEIGEVVRTPYGYHIIRLEEMR